MAFWLFTHVPPDDLEKVERDLYAPAPGSTGQESDILVERDAQAFMQFAGAFGVSPP